MDPSLDLAALRTQLEQILRDRQEFNASGQQCQQQIQQAQTQIASLSQRVEQLKGALAYIDLAEQRIKKEIAARTAVTIPPVVPTIAPALPPELPPLTAPPVVNSP